MRRREFICLAAGAVVIAWSAAGRAQQPDRIRRIGLLVPGAKNDPDQQFRLRAFQDALAESGWTDGRNLRIEVRYAAGNAEQFQTYAAEPLAVKPDVLMADATPSTSALRHATQAVPIVFARVADAAGKASS